MPEQDHKKAAIHIAVMVKKYIDDHPGTGISTAQLARDHHISRNLLQEAFKLRFKSPLGKYKLQKRMQEGSRLLTTGQSIKQVAFKLDYSSPSSFSNAFRNYFKQSPSQWLRKIKPKKKSKPKSGTNANKQV